MNAIETKQEYLLDEVLASLLENIEHYLFRKEDKKGLESLYLTNMFRLNSLATFQDQQGKFDGIIRGLDNLGMLQIEKSDGLATYNFKEVKYIL